MTDTASPHTPQKTALIIGAAGSFGGHAAAALAKHGWAIRALARDPAAAQAKAGPRMPIEWVKGDAMIAEDVVAAAHGVDVIVHAANPPAYRNWPGLVIPMFKNTLAAAKAVGARVLFPGTVYNFGPDAFPLLNEASPQRPLTRKGALRVKMEQRLAKAAAEGTPVLIVRAGDYFGPQVPSSWLTQGMVQAGRPVSMILNPSRAGVGHAWAYAPDVAQAMVELVAREDLSDFEVFHFQGYWMTRGDQMPLAIRRVVGRKVPILPLPWVMFRLLAPFVETFREMIEMRYLWRSPVRLDNSKLVRTLGREPHTPLDEALRATLVGQGCLPG